MDVEESLHLVGWTSGGLARDLTELNAGQDPAIVGACLIPIRQGLSPVPPDETLQCRSRDTGSGICLRAIVVIGGIRKDQRFRTRAAGCIIPFRKCCFISILSFRPTFVLMACCWSLSRLRHNTTMGSRPDVGAWRGFANRVEGPR